MDTKYLPTARLKRLSDEALLKNLIRCFVLLLLRRKLTNETTLKIENGGKIRIILNY